MHTRTTLSVLQHQAWNQILQRKNQFYKQAHNQFGTPGWAKSFLGVAQMF